MSSADFFQSDSSGRCLARSPGCPRRGRQAWTQREGARAFQLGNDGLLASEENDVYAISVGRCEMCHRETVKAVLAEPEHLAVDKGVLTRVARLYDYPQPLAP